VPSLRHQANERNPQPMMDKNVITVVAVVLIISLLVAVFASLI
jgi:hypothetical protein